ncbi:hypothetical protein EYW49_12875 [Siculibacillus lacustris]|uniref:PH domain-containing protein n=1 Tax=Siculibacillus lacustris TaxID=1549641 RepID=A0A4Q9VPA8_9HYPH|nr:hypothetical protein [Siculibacillus lacustris]TBW37037.1 hypothetical protein EYW49_12875 [Siculibacillus lacustris]
MPPTDPTLLVPVTLAARDMRRIPLLGLALGAAVAGGVLHALEPGLTGVIALAICWAMVLGCLALILPGANTLRLDAAGFRIRAWLVFAHTIPWNAVLSIDAGEAWSGGSVLIELAPAEDARRIPGLPRDPTLDRRSLVDSYGLEPEDLAEHMRALWRAAGGAAPGRRTDP